MDWNEIMADMDPQIAEWLVKLFSEERKEVEGAADNEHIWAEGSDTQEACMHFNNEELLREYAELLEKLEKEAAKNMD